MFSKADTNKIPLQKLQELLLHAKSGKDEALGELYNHYFEKIYRFIFYRVGHKEVAEDLTEDVFVKSFRSIHNLEKTGAFEGWLYQIARNQVIDYYRSKKNLLPLEEVENTLQYETNIIDVVNLQFEQKLLVKVLKDLSSEQQMVIKLKFIEDLDNETIAHIMDKNEGAIRVIQHRAIAKLKELIQSQINPD